MSVRLTATQLERLAKEIDALEAIEVEVKTFIFEGHTVFVDRASSDRPGAPDRLIIRGITENQASQPKLGGLTTRASFDPKAARNA